MESVGCRLDGDRWSLVADSMEIVGCRLHGDRWLQTPWRSLAADYIGDGPVLCRLWAMRRRRDLYAVCQGQRQAARRVEVNGQARAACAGR
eukprot:352242-Chlamydomonas_euryale.AAC.6